VRSRLRVPAVLLALAAVAGCDSPSSEEPAPERMRITEQGLVEHLRALQGIADRHGGERAAGTPGYRASVDYVAGVLRESGWRVRLEEVPFRLPTESSPPRLAIGPLGALEPVREFRAPTYSGSGQGRGALRPLDGGCSAADFAGLRAGEVALVPSGGCFNFVKARNAARAGALALLVGDDTRGRGVPSGTLVFAAPLPVLIVSRGIARRLSPGIEVSLLVDTAVERDTTQNVIADAGTGGRVSMAGAHLDSVPAGPGINDNGSGVATLLATAQALGPRPRGRVRLAFWGAEELGLVGSRHYVGSLSPDERREIAGYLNLDVVGSPNAVPAVYGDGDERLTRLLRRVHPGKEGAAAATGRSDHAPFDDAGVPVAGLYTGSEESGPRGRPRDPCYHLPCDTLENVDREVLLGMARATAKGLAELARQAK
jgi:hypothetical protein